MNTHTPRISLYGAYLFFCLASCPAQAADHGTAGPAADLANVFAYKKSAALQKKIYATKNLDELVKACIVRRSCWLVGPLYNSRDGFFLEVLQWCYHRLDQDDPAIGEHLADLFMQSRQKQKTFYTGEVWCSRTRQLLRQPVQGQEVDASFNKTMGFPLQSSGKARQKDISLVCSMRWACQLRLQAQPDKQVTPVRDEHATQGNGYHSATRSSSPSARSGLPEVVLYPLSESAASSPGKEGVTSSRVTGEPGQGTFQPKLKGTASSSSPAGDTPSLTQVVFFLLFLGTCIWGLCEAYARYRRLQAAPASPKTRKQQTRGGS